MDELDLLDWKRRVFDLYAEVSVDHCRTCGRNWLHYFLEFEGTSRSGRWYRGLIGPEVAFSHRNAAQIFEQLPEYWAGGSTAPCGL